MPEISVKVGSSVGLHARPAAIFANAAAACPVVVTVRKVDGEPVQARSVLSVLTLDARQGDELILEAEGEGAEEALRRLAELLTEDHDKAGA